ncbi:hypothetical protein NDU88_003093 [Pleurodeles waltl]|uniref:Uncharacterized protein n=1 Tax=Pleurodeles waltl TaxID=8319 RepID=A0AAV7UZ32_PLEWA|nr:hypothetical protein NDU88_003093 [Pleurodeles waltl]
MGPGGLPSIHLVYVRLQAFVVVDERSHRLGPEGVARAARLFTLFSPFFLIGAGVPFSCVWSWDLFPGAVALVRAHSASLVVSGHPLRGRQRPRPLWSLGAPLAPLSAPRSTTGSACLPHSVGVTHRAARSASASLIPVAVILHRRYLRAGARRRSSSACAFPPSGCLDVPRKPVSRARLQPLH